MQSVPVNNYLKTCSTSFPGAQSASLSTLNSLQGMSNFNSCKAQGLISTEAEGECPQEGTICS